MKQKKNKFFTLIFSMMFGAGQMYMGFMKQGLSIMGCAIGIIAVGLITQLNIFYLLLPLIWFYGFFDSINKRALPDETFLKSDDISIIPFEINTQLMKKIIDKYQIFIGGGFVFLGICILNNSVLSYIVPRGSLLLRLVGPQFLIAVLIIAVGVQLIRGKREEFISLWKVNKNIEKSHHKQEENKVSMAMFQPESPLDCNIEISPEIEAVK